MLGTECLSPVSGFSETGDRRLRPQPPPCATILCFRRGVVVKPVTLLGLLALALATGCNSDTSASADVVARVNGKDISTAQLEKQFQARITGAEQPPAPEEIDDL